jgi:hypothetical protein
MHYGALILRFFAKDPACFELKNVEAADVGDELDLVATAEQGNDFYVTFKQAYAGSTTLNMNALLQATSHILGHQSPAKTRT